MDKHLLGTLAGIGIVADVTAGLIKRDQEKHRARIAQADAEAREARAASRADRQRKAEEKAQEREWAKGEVERERQRLAREHEAYLRAQEEAAERYYADMLEKRLQLIAEAERRSVSIQREKEEAYKAQLEKDALEREAKAARTLPPPDNPQAFFWGPEAKLRYAMRKDHPEFVQVISPLYNLAYRESAGKLLNDAADLILSELETAEQGVRSSLMQLPAHLKAKLFAFAPELATEQDALNADAHRAHWFQDVSSEIARTRYGANWDESRVVADIVPTTDLRELHQPTAHLKNNLLTPAQMSEQASYAGPSWLPANSREDLYPPMLSEGMVHRGVRLPTEAAQCLRSALSGLPQDWATPGRPTSAPDAVPKATYHAMLERMENHAMRSLLLDAWEEPDQVQAMKDALGRAREIAKAENEALERVLATVGHELAQRDPNAPRRLSENTPEGHERLSIRYQDELAEALHARVVAGVWSLDESLAIYTEIVALGDPNTEPRSERRRLSEHAQKISDTFDLNQDFDLPIINGMGEPEVVRITPEKDPLRIAMTRHPLKP